MSHRNKRRHLSFVHSTNSKYNLRNTMNTAAKYRQNSRNVIHSFSNSYVLFLVVLEPRVGHTMDALSSFTSVILIDSSTVSLVHVLMLSIQAVCGLPRLCAPGIVHFSKSA